MANKTAAYSFPMPYSMGGMNAHHHAAAAGLDPLSWLSAAQHHAAAAGNSTSSAASTTTNSMSANNSSVNGSSSASSSSSANPSLDLDKSRLFGFASPYGSHQHPYYGMAGLPGMPGLAGLAGLSNLNGNNSSAPRMSPDSNSPVSRMDGFAKGSPSPVATPTSMSNGSNNCGVVNTSVGMVQQQQQQQSPAALYSSLMYTKASAAAAASYHQAAAAAAAAGMQYPVAPGGYPSLDQLAGLRRPVPVLY